MTRFLFPAAFRRSQPKPDSEPAYEVPDDIEDRILLMGARELQCLQMQCRGWTREQIAQRLNTSRTTISSHLIRAYKRLGINNVAEMMLIAFELGWIETRAIRKARAEETVRLAKVEADTAELRALRH